MYLLAYPSGVQAYMLVMSIQKTRDQAMFVLEEVLLHRLGEWPLFSLPVWAYHETVAARVSYPS